MIDEEFPIVEIIDYYYNEDGSYMVVIFIMVDGICSFHNTYTYKPVHPKPKN
ncbi:MAG: hypothetical protein ACK4YF_08165 [Exilispira sp.]